MEIGGYFGLEDFSGNEYYPDLIALNTGRNALAYLIRTKKIKKIFIPEYICDSIYKLCEREECDYEFYEIDFDFKPKFDNILKENEWLYLVNYFGQLTNELEYKKKYGRIILDNSQAFFQKPKGAIDTIYSCRKFFGVPDGAYLASDETLDLPQDYSKDRMIHILGRYEINASDYYQDFVCQEEAFYELEPKYMSKLTHNILRALDYEMICKKREHNYLFLAERLGNRNGLDLKMPIGPYAYPFYTENGMKFRNYLIKNGIYIPTLWPNLIQDKENKLALNLLPLPVDQRYGIDEMKILVNNMISLLNETR